MPREEGLHEWKVWSDVLGIEQRGSFHVEKIDSYPTDFLEFGPIKVSASRRHFEHLNGSPFLFLSDTCWYGPMRATDIDWNHYVEKRVEQGFTAVQFMA